jgi:hypothetical protein
VIRLDSSEEVIVFIDSRWGRKLVTWCRSERGVRVCEAGEVRGTGSTRDTRYASVMH